MSAETEEIQWCCEPQVQPLLKLAYLRPDAMSNIAVCKNVTLKELE